MQRMIETNDQTIEKHARNLADCAEWLALTSAAEKIAEGKASTTREAESSRTLSSALAESARTVQQVASRLETEIKNQRENKANAAIERKN